MKTLKEFDYDLWTTVENGTKHYFARVKITGEVSEISLDVMRLLRSEERRMRRELEARRNGRYELSYDAVPCESDSVWEIDPHDTFADIDTDAVEACFVNALTDRQRDLYFACMKGGLSLRKYADEKGLKFGTVWDTQEAIRKKYIKLFGGYLSNGKKMSVVR